MGDPANVHYMRMSEQNRMIAAFEAGVRKELLSYQLVSRLGPACGFWDLTED